MGRIIFEKEALDKEALDKEVGEVPKLQKEIDEATAEARDLTEFIRYSQKKPEKGYFLVINL